MKRYMCEIACTAFSASIIKFPSNFCLMFINIQLKDSSAQICLPFLAQLFGFVTLISGIDTRTTCELMAFSRQNHF